VWRSELVVEDVMTDKDHGITGHELRTAQGFLKLDEARN
jgi:hypothetical protein